MKDLTLTNNLRSQGVCRLSSYSTSSLYLSEIIAKERKKYPSQNSKGTKRIQQLEVSLEMEKKKSYLLEDLLEGQSKVLVFLQDPFKLPEE